MTRAVLIVVVLAPWAVPLGAQTAPPAKPAQASGNAQDLSSQATDPTAALMSLNFLNDVKVSHWDNDEGGFEFEFKPVVPFAAWGKANILRVVVPFQTAGPGEEGLKDVSIFDLVILPQKWGRLGLGPVMRWAESSGGAASKFLIGPAVLAVHPLSKRLNIGLLNQNLFASEAAVTQLQPIVAYQVGGGWALSAGDSQFTYDWKSGEWTSLPLGFQIGVVRRLAGQPFRFFINPQWNQAHIADEDRSTIVFGVTMLVPSK